MTFPMRVGVPFLGGGYFGKTETSNDTPIEGGHTFWGMRVFWEK